MIAGAGPVGLTAAISAGRLGVECIIIEKGNKPGAEFLLQSEVTELIEKDKRCIGLKYRDKDNAVHDLFATTVLNCMGHNDPLGSQYGIDRKEIDCPTIKYFSRNAQNVNLATHPNLQFYMIPPGMLTIASDLPPAVAYVFPLKNGEMEAGLMLRLGPMKSLKGVKVPNEKKMFEVWDYLTGSYPGFSDFFKGAETSYKKLTVISNRSLFENVIPHKEGGLIFLGDTIGFSEANGSSGLYFGMAQADFWVRRILESSGKGGDIWDYKFTEKLMRQYRNWSVYKYIRKSYRDIILAEKIMFKTFGTEKLLNLWWRPLMALLQLKS